MSKVKGSFAKITVADRILGALYGLVAGDALGVPVEFLDRKLLS